MISAGEVGAIFVVNDEASGALQKIADEFNRIQGLVDKITAAFDKIGGADGGLRALQEALGLTAKAGEDSAKTISEAFGGVDKAVSTATEGVNTLKRSFTEAAEAARAIQASADRIGIGSGGGSGPHSRGGGSGEFGTKPYEKMIMHPAANALGMTSLITGNPAIDIPIELLGAGIEQSAQVEDRITKILMNANQPQSEANKQALRDQFYSQAKQNGISPVHTADAFLAGGRLLSSLPYDEQLKVQRSLLPAARVEQQMKPGVSLEEGQEKFIELAHQSGVYDAAGLEKLSNAFAFASTHTASTLPQFERALSYSLPELHSTLGMDPETVMALTVMTQNAGITNTKSGTWMRSMFEHSVEQEGTSKQVQAHNKALHEMGMTDEHGNSNWMVKGEDGKTDWSKSVEKFAEIAKKFNEDNPDPAHRMSVTHAAYGTQGASQESLMAMDTFVKQLPEILKNLPGYKGTVDANKTLMDNSPVAQFQKTVAEAEEALTRLGGTALPMFVSGLKGVDAALEQISTVLDSVQKFKDGKAFDEDGIKNVLFGPKGTTLRDLVDKAHPSQGPISHLPEHPHTYAPEKTAIDGTTPLVWPGDLYPRQVPNQKPSPSHPASTGLWPALTGPIPVQIVAMPGGEGGRQFLGRDPRSPATGPYSYVPPPPQPAPIVNVTNNISPPVTNVSVNVDGAAVTASVMTRIEKETRVATGIASHDGQASYRIPDQGGIRHQ
jgi:hypothetical protein